MCGIVGAVAKLNSGFFSKQDDSFFQMLYADALRGFDSTGVVGVERHGHFHILKEASEATFVIPEIRDQHWYKEKMSGAKMEGKAWIGHNRKSTVGKTNDESAHPFVVNNEFAFVHNGTLTNWEHLIKDWKNKPSVDSEALAIMVHGAMGEKKWKEELEELFGKVYGAYACVWYDARVGKVFLIRNNQRPLGIVETNNCFYFASEPAMAWWILGRNEYRGEDMKHHLLGEHQLVSFDLEETKLEVTQLTPKKASSPAPHSRSTPTAGDKPTSKISGEVQRELSLVGVAGTKGKPTFGWSKTQKKNFKRAWMGRLVRFHVDEYIERNYPRTFANGETEIFIMGEIEDITVNHLVKGYVDTALLGLKYEEQIVDRMWHGMVMDIAWDETEGTVDIFVDKAKPIVQSLPPRKTLQLVPTFVDTNNPPFSTTPNPIDWEAERKRRAANHVFPTSHGVQQARDAVMERVNQMTEQYEKTCGKVEQVIDGATGKVQIIGTEGANKGKVLYETPIAIH